MTTTEATPAESGEAQVRRTIDQFMSAVKAKNFESVMSFYTPDVVAFDMLPPLRYAAEGYRKVWEDGLQMMKGPIVYELRDLTVVARQDVAFCHALSHMSLQEQGMDLWMRWTACFRNIGGRWLIAHEHTSVPSDMDNGRAIMDLKP